MKRIATACLIWATCLSVPAGARVQTLDLTFEPAQVSASAGQIRYAGLGVEGRPGAWATPVKTVWLELDAGERLAAVEISSIESTPLAVDRPQRVPFPAGAQFDEAPPAQPWARPGAGGFLRGRHLWAIQIWPVRRDPSGWRLATRLQLKVTIEPDPSRQPLPRFRQTAADDKVARALEANWGLGRPPAPSGGYAEPGPFQPTFRPTADGSPVEYVVVTTDALATEFERLARWKTEKGVPATVRTIEWINTTYPNGADLAERLRFFVRDACQNWGTLFVLLGGDTDLVPTRYAETTFFGGESIPADMYFGCLEGNWNADGDAAFGEGTYNAEPGDQCDLFFEVSIGRAPVSNLEAAQIFIDKQIDYERNPPATGPYPTNIVLMAERLFDEVHGAEISEDLMPLIPAWYTTLRLYEESSSFPGSLELDRTAALSAIEAGYGIVHHVGHGFRNTMSVAQGTINNSDADAFQNGPRNSVVFAINCSSASIDFNTIGERFVRNPDGGAIAYIGTSRLAFAAVSGLYQNAWYEAALVDSVVSLGILTDSSRAALAAGAEPDGSLRWNLMATTLIGDPETEMHVAPVAPMTVTHPSPLGLTQAPVTVHVESAGQPLAGARVTLLAADSSAYTRATTDGAGDATLEFRPAAAGSATLTVTRPHYRAYQTTLAVVEQSSPYLALASHAIDDDSGGASSGDDDGRADQGETIELALTVVNAGGSSAANVTGVLSADDPAGVLTLETASATYGALAPGGMATSTPFVIDIHSNVPDAYQPILTLTLSSGGNDYLAQLALPIRRSYVHHTGHQVDDAPPRGNGNGQIDTGERIYFKPELRNSGLETAEGVTAALRVLDSQTLTPHSGVTVLDANSSFGTLQPGTTQVGDRFDFDLGSGVSATDILLELTLADQFGTLASATLDAVPPATIDAAGLKAFGAPFAITLKFDPAPDPDIQGYDVWRATTAQGPYTRINPFTVSGSATYEDAGLEPLTRRYYQVVSRDASQNASAPSAAIEASTNPAQKAGWPAALGLAADASPIAANLDGAPEFELAIASDAIYAWHADGSELVDGDDDERTNGVFSLRGFDSDRGFGATAAIGALAGGTALKLVNVGWRVDSLFVWDPAGQLAPGWPQPVYDQFNWASPALVDLDLDGDLEIVAWAGRGGRLFAWHHDGTEFADGDQNPATHGVLARVFGISFSYGSPLICALDADLYPEIVVPVNLGGLGEVYAFNHDGSQVPGWPFVTGTQSIPSEVSASPVAADFDGDGRHEVVINCERQGGRVYLVDGDGQVMPGWPIAAAAWTTTARIPSPALADLTGDGVPEIILPGTDGWLRAWTHLGGNVGGFPVAFADPAGGQRTQSSPVVGDVNGDGKVDILFGDESGTLHAIDADGVTVPGFPIQTAGEIKGSPMIWDIDADNLVEIAAASFDGSVLVWEMPFDFNPAMTPWPFFRHDTHNTGAYDAHILPVGLAAPQPVPRLARIRAVWPNPTRRRAHIAVDTGAPGRTRLAVYDPAGRLIRRLANLGPGTHLLEWDGKLANGRPAPAGVYFLQLEGKSAPPAAKLTLVR